MRRALSAALAACAAAAAMAAMAAPQSQAQTQPGLEARIDAFERRLTDAETEVCGAPSGRRFHSPGASAYAPSAAHASAPWMAKLEIVESDPGGRIAAVANCGAAALTRNWLITAAHCVAGGPWLAVEATLGARDLDDPRALRHSGAVALCPTAYDPATTEGAGTGPQADLALLRLRDALPPDFPTLRVASPGELARFDPSVPAYAAGWPRKASGVSMRLSAPSMRLIGPPQDGVYTARPVRDGSALCLGESGAPLVADLGLGPVMVGVFSSVDAFFNPDSGEVEELCAGYEAKSYFTALGGWQQWISAAIRACDQDVAACLSAR